MAILDQNKLPVMHKQNSDSSELPTGISRGGVNSDTKLVSWTGKGGPTRLPTTHARKSSTKQPTDMKTTTHAWKTTQPTGIMDMKRSEKVTFSCMDIREKQKLSPMTGLLRNDKYKEVMNILMLLFERVNHNS